ncbi:MAG: hypothetical protein FWE03_03945 [Firmicutes bacterium]|nr:hypothetical protein [Bacillota bacterium]
MQIKEQIKLAAYNLTRHKKTSVQCIVMMTAIILIASFSSFFIATLVFQLQDSVDIYSSTNYIQVIAIEDIGLPNQVQLAQLKSKFPTINDHILLRSTWDLIGNPSHHVMIVDGIRHYGDGSITDLKERFQIDYTGSGIFNHNVMQEFNLRFSGQEIIKYGRDIQNAGEILLPYHLVRAYNLDPQYLLDAENIVFSVSPISGVHELDEWEVYSGKVVGIFNSNFFELGSIEHIGGGGNRIRFIAVFMSPHEDVETIFSKEILRLFLSDTQYAETIRQHIEDNFYGLFASWGNQAIANRLDFINRIRIFTQNIILVLLLTIGLAILFFLYSVIDYNIKQKGSYYGMMRAMGMKSTGAINFIEIIILSVLSVFLSAIIFFPTVLVLNGIEIIFDFFTRFFLVSNGLIIGLSFAVTALVVIIINIAIVAISSKLSTSSSIIKSLRL